MCETTQACGQGTCPTQAQMDALKQAETPAVVTEPTSMPKPAWTPKTHWDKISATKLNMFLGCARKFYIRYRLKVSEPANAAMQRGSLVHKVLENFFADKDALKGDLDFLALRLEARMLEMFDAEWGKPSYYLLETETEMKEETREALLFYIALFMRQFEPLARKYSVWAAWAMLRPKFSEKEIQTEKHVAYIDTISEKDGETIITDYKTSKVFGSGLNEEYINQLKFYGYLYYLTEGKKPDALLIDYVLFGQRVAVKFTEKDNEDMKALLQHFESMLVEEDYQKFPKNPNYQWCKTCYFRKATDITGKPLCDGDLSTEWSEKPEVPKSKK